MLLDCTISRVETGRNLVSKNLLVQEFLLAAGSSRPIIFIEHYGRGTFRNTYPLNVTKSVQFQGWNITRGGSMSLRRVFTVP